ncbi:MAG TPA: DNA repair protein RadC [Streptosporangiaceae bacterium]|jgi:DNA repair protein RadC
MLMHQVPVSDRPRERLSGLGAEALADRELLALMLGTGMRGRGAHEVAEALLARLGSVAAIGQAEMAELAAVPGIGTAKAASVVAGFELARRSAAAGKPGRLRTTADIAAAAAGLRGLARERLLVISCDAALRVIGTDRICDGTGDATMFGVREIVVAVLRRDGRSFALAHNHPSGDPAPSPEDIAATEAAAQAAETTGLCFLDHVIVTETTWQAVPLAR